MPTSSPTTKTPQNGAVRTSLSGYKLLLDPALNKGTAFTTKERDEFALHGLLPPHVGSLQEQRERRKKSLDSQSDAFAKYSLLRDLQDTNEVLFYALIKQHMEELLPLVYTPTVGEGCQRFSEIWRKPRGLFISYANRHRIPQMLADPRYDSIRCIVVSDGERILGLGDQGAGGMGIPIGKMALYTALGGIPPSHCLPILLDVGTDNEDLLNNPIYVGWQHKRVRGKEYDRFIESFVKAVQSRWPHILLQWEDFAGENALALLERYRNRLCSFNDDIQGTAAVTTGTLLAAINATGVPIKKQTIAMYGSGSAGIGIVNLLVAAMKKEGLTEAQARARIYAFNRHGLLVEGGQGIRPSQLPLVRKRADVAGWQLSGKPDISLLEVVRNAKITALVGVSAQAGAFTEDVVRAMAANAQRPVIFPLSNPTSKSEAAPEDLMRWTDGRALVGTGSPFAPVEINGKQVPVSQVNNSYIFPGLALGILVSRASRVTDSMIMAAAEALAALSPARKDKNAPLLPPIADARKVSFRVGAAVASQAIAEGLTSGVATEAIEAQLRAYMWEPVYAPYERIAGDKASF
ncbi:MAG: NAD-dependent malic enzyme [Terracidiphilus sp.]|nr:NAD-dependent malic enzyme [Terracidiphilus sp.]